MIASMEGRKDFSTSVISSAECKTFDRIARAFNTITKAKWSLPNIADVRKEWDAVRAKDDSVPQPVANPRTRKKYAQDAAAKKAGRRATTGRATPALAAPLGYDDEDNVADEEDEDDDGDNAEDEDDDGDSDGDD